MATTTVTTFLKDIADSVGENWFDVEIQSQMLVWLKHSWEQLFTLSDDWVFALGRETVTTVTGTAAYSLSGNTGSVRAVHDDTTSLPLQQLNEDQMVFGGLDMDEEGTPVYYLYDSYDVTAGKVLLRFWPTPNSIRSYSVYRTLDPSELTLASVIPVPPAFHSPIRKLVEASFLESLGDENTSRRKRSEALRELTTLRDRFRATPRGIGEVDIPCVPIATPQLPWPYPATRF